MRDWIHRRFTPLNDDGMDVPEIFIFYAPRGAHEETCFECREGLREGLALPSCYFGKRGSYESLHGPTPGSGWQTRRKF